MAGKEGEKTEIEEGGKKGGREGGREEEWNERMKRERNGIGRLGQSEE